MEAAGGGCRQGGVRGRRREARGGPRVDGPGAAREDRRIDDGAGFFFYGVRGDEPVGAPGGGGRDGGAEHCEAVRAGGAHGRTAHGLSVPRRAADVRAPAPGVGGGEREAGAEADAADGDSRRAAAADDERARARPPRISVPAAGHGHRGGGSGLGAWTSRTSQ